ncbi:hypothetical protein GCM10008171_24810 [Methylopila jiangsuensis]|uniref:Uncharacterized protein n=1 Tax=Methylopila jiangsuensis TaxID=586230 RepID=A0A9W6JHN9_9HYPH|nr:hypothetical protein [Methylopila jiangsuensis]MDR6286435.1 hypothetical protein [Methylopila jiangsuensis]GLK77227.1 hypothetical protein GCM10008171_24810 [Methylopila jiangsuensis]
MEAIETLAEGDDGVRSAGPIEYFETFYDWIPHRDDGEMRPNTAVTDRERAALLELSRMLDDACDATPRHMTIEDLIATGWPTRIQPFAITARDVMNERGRLSENDDALPE